ncbi:hypothetical protein FRC07_005564, partial [Ceratobasidium sp. 392]
MTDSPNKDSAAAPPEPPPHPYTPPHYRLRASLHIPAPPRISTSESENKEEKGTTNLQNPIQIQLE